MALILATLMLGGCERIQFLHELDNYGFDLADSTPQDTTETNVTATRDGKGRAAELLSAFYGLDNGLPKIANKAICKGAAGQDGMPVVFSHEVDVESMQAGDFRVMRASGAVGEITCVTLAPADDRGELRTVLVAGEYGSPDDPPARVEIIGNLLSSDGQLNFRGLGTLVIPLEEGPTMEWAEVVPPEQWDLGRAPTLLPWGGGSRCPAGTDQVVRVTWAGGITKPGGDDVDDLERAAYRVTAVDDRGNESEIVPFALADLGDGDNNHELCLDRVVTPIRVHFPEGLVTDPRDDLNPATTVTITSH